MAINKRSVKIEISSVAQVTEIDANMSVTEQLTAFISDVDRLLNMAGYGGNAKRGIIYDIDSCLTPALKSPRPYAFQVAGPVEATVTLSELGYPESHSSPQSNPDDLARDEYANLHRRYEEFRTRLERFGNQGRNRNRLRNGNYSARRGYRTEDCQEWVSNGHHTLRDDVGIKLEYCGRVKTLEPEHAYIWVVQGITEDLCRGNSRMDRHESLVIEEQLSATLEYLIKSPYGTKVALGEQFKDATLELVNLRKGREMSFTEMFNDPKYWDLPESK